MTLLKNEIKDALEKKDFERVEQLAIGNRKVFSALISLAYDKEDVLCWRAIEAMGKAAGAVAVEDSPTVRNIVQRLIWSMSEESGGIGWSAPEMLGEIVRNSPGAFHDILAIILSFREEEMFLKGVLWAIGRIGDAGVALGNEASELVVQCLDHKDAQVRGLAVIAVSRMRIAEGKEKITEMISDSGRATIYEDHELREKTVGNLAIAALGRPNPFDRVEHKVL